MSRHVVQAVLGSASATRWRGPQGAGGTVVRGPLLFGGLFVFVEGQRENNVA